MVNVIMTQLYAGYLIWRSEAKLFVLFGEAVRTKKNNTGIYFEYSVNAILKHLCSGNLIRKSGAGLFWISGVSR